MTLDSIMLALFNDLEPWVKGKGGRLTLTDNQWDAMEALIQGPVGLQVILVWGGDTQEGDQAQSPLATQTIELLVGYNLGLEAQQGAALIKNRANRPSLLKLINDARARLLSARFPDGNTDQYPMYLGTQPVVVDGMPLKAYRIRTTFGAAVETETEYRDIGTATEMPNGD